MKKTKVLVLGAGGIVGQHMLMDIPNNVEATFTRREEHGAWVGFDAKKDDLTAFLDICDPDVIINLIGENRVDVVEADAGEYLDINALLPGDIMRWAAANERYFIQGSTQGIFDGETAPYSPTSATNSLTHYGVQKTYAELSVVPYEKTKIARLTFVLGIRPFQEIGRKNPVEVMLENKMQLQVDDRFFSPLFATDAAEILWDMALNPDNYDKITHLGNPQSCTRFSIATDLKYYTYGAMKGFGIRPVSHEYFFGIAQRPRDTTWAPDNCVYRSSYEEGIIVLYLNWKKLKS